MATTPQESQQDQTDFGAAFGEDQAKRPEQTEDEAFGLAADAQSPSAPEDHEAPAEDPAETSAGESGGEGQAGGDSGNAAPAVAIVVEPGAEDNSSVASDDTAMSDKDKQREKSWEGRLKAREAELKAREDALAGKDAAPAAAETPAEMSAEGTTPAEEAAESPQTEALEDAVEKVSSGELTVEQAMKTLSQDFGEDFTKMLGVLIDAKASEIAGRTADEKVSGVSKTIDGIVGELKNEREQKHFETIADAHPDFKEVAASPEFKEYIDKLPATEKEAALATIGTGSARSINQLLTSFKAGNEPVANATPDDAGIDAAEGVRSRGLKIPDQPVDSQDYEDAWDKF